MQFNVLNCWSLNSNDRWFVGRFVCCDVGWPLRSPCPAYLGLWSRATTAWETGPPNQWHALSVKAWRSEVSHSANWHPIQWLCSVAILHGIRAFQPLDMTIFLHLMFDYFIIIGLPGEGWRDVNFFFANDSTFLPSHNGVFKSQVSSLSTTSLLQVINNHGGEIGTIKSAVPLLKRRCWQCTLVKVQPIKHWGGGITRKRENVRLKMCLLQPNSMHLLVALQQFFTLMFNSLTDFFSNYSLPGNYCYYFLLMPL